MVKQMLLMSKTLYIRDVKYFLSLEQIKTLIKTMSLKIIIINAFYAAYCQNKTMLPGVRSIEPHR